MGPQISMSQYCVSALGLKSINAFFGEILNTVNQYLPADCDENINLLLFTVTSVSRSTNEFSCSQQSSGPLWSRQHETGLPSLSSPVFPFWFLQHVNNCSLSITGFKSEVSSPSRPLQSKSGWRATVYPSSPSGNVSGSRHLSQLHVWASAFPNQPVSRQYLILCPALLELPISGPAGW